METETFTPGFAAALLENMVVSLGIVIIVPIIMLARSGAHRGMTIAYAVGTGLIAAILLLLYYTIRFLVRVPKQIAISESGLLFGWRNGAETAVRWDDVRRAVFRARWGYRWKFFLDDSSPILWGDGFSAVTWEKMSDLVEAQLGARNVPMEKYDPYGKRVS